MSISLFKSADLADLIGCYDQKTLIDSLFEIKKQISISISTNYQNSTLLQETLLQINELLAFSNSENMETSKITETISQIINLINSNSEDSSSTFLNLIAKKLKNIIAAKVLFQWTDSLVIEAIEKGHWLILENCQEMSPALLEKLNAILEEGEEIIMNECVEGKSGDVRVLKKHPSFKAFLNLSI